jgi:hypothetical protein
MDEVHKTVTTQYYTPSSKPFRILGLPFVLKGLIVKGLGTQDVVVSLRHFFRKFAASYTVASPPPHYRLMLHCSVTFSYVSGSEGLVFSEGEDVTVLV